MIQIDKNNPIRGERSLLLGLLLATLLVGLLLAASPAHASTTFTVNNTGDGSDTNLGDGVCRANLSGSVDQCTLRAAIEGANFTPGADAIHFDIPSALSVETITPTSPLPFITDTVTIDGYTQPGAHPNTRAVGNDAVLKIELNGAKAGDFADGLAIADTGSTSASGSVIKGLVVNRFDGTGIVVSASAGNKIEGNFVGTDFTGTLDRGNNSAGVGINGVSNTVGGTTPAARNVISGNFVGVTFCCDQSRGNKVLGNFVGTEKDGATALGNTDAGVIIQGGTDNTFIGGATAAAANTIAFNGKQGVSVTSFTSNDTIGNRILRNSIFSNGRSNGALGIELNFDGPTPNDPKDKDAGPNGLQNKPVLSSAKTSSTKTTVTGKLNSTPGKTFSVRFFANPPGGDEGKRFLGLKRVTTNAGGDVSVAKALPKVAVGKTITATATGFEGTSEFSAPRKVVAS